MSFQVRMTGFLEVKCLKYRSLLLNEFRIRTILEFKCLKCCSLLLNEFQILMTDFLEFICLKCCSLLNELLDTSDGFS